MHTAPTHMKPAAAASLAKWHAMIASRDLTDLPRIVHPLTLCFARPWLCTPTSPQRC